MDETSFIEVRPRDGVIVLDDEGVNLVQGLKMVDVR
jgi:hypothetical protein